MRIGIPAEIKPHEGRVALVPAACGELHALGHAVQVQAGAGRRAGYADADYRAAGAEIVPDAAALYGGSEVIVKVKEPVGPELDLLRRDHVLFSFLHLAAAPALAERLRRIVLTAFAYETLTVDGRRPVLAPMSRIAGRLAVQVGATLLHEPQGGAGLLLGGVADTDAGQVVILGAGAAGMAACAVAVGLGAAVQVLDIDRHRLARLSRRWPTVEFLPAEPQRVAQVVRGADLLGGAVWVPGRHAPHVVRRADVAAMAAGRVVVDIAIDQGGCIETARPTTWDAPTYRAEGVLHLAVTNLPGAVPRTATQALSAAVLPWVKRFLAGDWQRDAALRSALNVADGEYRHPAIRAELGGAGG